MDDFDFDRFLDDIKTELTVQSPAAKKTTNATNKKFVNVPSSIDGIRLAYKYEREKIYTPDTITADFTQINPGDFVRLEPEPSNPYDKMAVAVYVEDEKIGYLYKGRIKDMVHDFQRDELPIYAHISAIDDEERVVFLFVAFYRNQKQEAESNGYYRIPLTVQFPAAEPDAAPADGAEINMRKSRTSRGEGCKTILIVLSLIIVGLLVLSMAVTYVIGYSGVVSKSTPAPITSTETTPAPTTNTGTTPAQTVHAGDIDVALLIINDKLSETDDPTYHAHASGDDELITVTVWLDDMSYGGTWVDETYYNSFTSNLVTLWSAVRQMLDFLDFAETDCILQLVDCDEHDVILYTVIDGEIADYNQS